MSSIAEYGKIAVRMPNGKYRIIQPKSMSVATEKEEREILDLVFRGEYKIVVAAVPGEVSL